jgi:hypothetical protein
METRQIKHYAGPLAQRQNCVRVAVEQFALECPAIKPKEQFTNCSLPTVFLSAQISFDHYLKMNVAAK